MVLSEIEKLLEKYEEGGTSLEEEKQLRNYFLTDNVPSYLEHYKPVFTFYKTSSAVVFKNEIVVPKKRNNYYNWLAIAAALIIGIGFYFKKPPQEELGTYSNPEIAYDEFKNTMDYLSKNFKKGTSKVGYLQQLNQAGTQVGYLEEIENTTSLIFRRK